MRVVLLCSLFLGYCMIVVESQQGLVTGTADITSGSIITPGGSQYANALHELNSMILVERLPVEMSSLPIGSTPFTCKSRWVSIRAGDFGSDSTSVNKLKKGNVVVYSSSFYSLHNQKVSNVSSSGVPAGQQEQQQQPSKTSPAHVLHAKKAGSSAKKGLEGSDVHASVVETTHGAASQEAALKANGAAPATQKGDKCRFLTQLTRGTAAVNLTYVWAICTA